MKEEREREGGRGKQRRLGVVGKLDHPAIRRQRNPIFALLELYLLSLH